MSDHYGSLLNTSDSSSNPETIVQKLLVDANDYFDIPAPASSPASALQDIQQQILAGNRAEALRIALASQAWSHALLLAQINGPEAYLTKDFEDTIIFYTFDSPHVRECYHQFCNNGPSRGFSPSYHVLAECAPTSGDFPRIRTYSPFAR